MTLKHKKINKVVLISVAAIILIAVGWVAYFIYHDVYQTIILVPELGELQTQVSFDLVQIDTFENILADLQTKTASLEIDWAGVKNPF